MSALRVLLADDEEELVSTLAERLELRGYEVTYVLNGLDAVQRLQEQVFDVIILDVMMPGKNGLEVLMDAGRMRPGTPVILLTGRGDEKDSEAGLKHGAFDYIMKPVNIDRLIDIMKKAMEGHAGTQG